MEHQDDFLAIEELCEPLNSGERKGFRNKRVWRLSKKGVIAYTKCKIKLD